MKKVYLITVIPSIFVMLLITGCVNVSVMDMSGAGWVPAEKIYYISWITALYFLFRYFNAMFGEYGQNNVKLMYTVCTVLACFAVIAAPVSILNYIYYPVLLLYFAGIVYSLSLLIIVFKRKKRKPVIFLSAFLIIFILILIDNTSSAGISRINSAALAGIILFCIIQSVIIGKEIDFQFNENKKLSSELHLRNADLAALNSDLEKNVAKKTADLNNQNRIITMNNKLIMENNLELEGRIEEAIRDMHRKDDMMIINSRQAAMGEMIGFIGHQWKQNIYAISLYTEAMKNIIKQKGTLDIEKTKENLEKIDSFIIEMYNNLNDFSDFMKPKKDAEYFPLQAAVEETLRLMNDFIIINSVEIIRDYKSEPLLTGFSNEMKQVIVNIVKNAVDVFNEKNARHRIITITVQSIENMDILSISDNAGGIPLTNPDLVFDRFYTSKDEGTGIGLYLSRMIIEQRFGGKIEVHNREGGACFTISIPVFIEDTVF